VLGIACACAWLLACAATAGANSIFSVGGLGEPQLEEAARLRALGGAGAAEHGPRDISLVNPASLADVDRLLLQATVVPAYRKISATSVSENANETTFPSARAIIALPGRLVLSGSYVSGTDAEFTVERPETTGAHSILRVDGTGGINFLRLSLARRLVPALRLGVDWEVISGSYRETWFRTFTDSGLVNSRDTLEVKYPKKGRFRFGAQLVKGDWTLGGVFETSQSLPVEQRRSTPGAVDFLPGKRMIYPSGLILGASAPVTERVRAVAQYRRANWRHSSLESDLVDFRPLQRFSFGVERKDAGPGEHSALKRMPIRIGAYILQWPDLLPRAGAVDISGGTVEVNERAITLGGGIVTKDQGGGLDLSLELGTRGDKSDLGISEKFLRLGISFLVSDETWRGSFHK
jgi:hypothetical protein